MQIGLPACPQSKDAPMSRTESWFDRSIGIENSGIINGPEYRMTMLGTSSNPFFESGETRGRISYDHQWYDVPILYDVYKDELVVKHLSASGRGWFINLEKTRVQSFMIGDRLFMNFSRGFHEVIFDTPGFQVVAKRAKVSMTRGRTFNYVVNDEYFIVESGRWRPLRGKGGFLKMVDKEERRAVKLFIRQNNIRVRKFRSKELANVASFVNTIRLRRKS
jgi:hypothetical protein